MNISRKLAAGILLGMTALAGNAPADGNSSSGTTILKEGKEMELEQRWDKTFPKSDKVEHRKVSFRTVTASPLRAISTPQGEAMGNWLPSP